MPTRARTALVGAAISSALLALIWLLAFHTGLGEHADQFALCEQSFDLCLEYIGEPDAIQGRIRAPEMRREAGERSLDDRASGRSHLDTFSR